MEAAAAVLDETEVGEIKYGVAARERVSRGGGGPGEGLRWRGGEGGRTGEHKKEWSR